MRFKSVVCTFLCSEVREKESPDSQSLGYIDDFFYKKTSH